MRREHSTGPGSLQRTRGIIPGQNQRWKAQAGPLDRGKGERMREPEAGAQHRGRGGAAPGGQDWPEQGWICSLGLEGPEEAPSLDMRTGMEAAEHWAVVAKGSPRLLGGEEMLRSQVAREGDQAVERMGRNGEKGRGLGWGAVRSGAARPWRTTGVANLPNAHRALIPEFP